MDLAAHMVVAIGSPSKQGQRHGSPSKLGHRFGSFSMHGHHHGVPPANRVIAVGLPANRGIALDLSACMAVTMGSPTMANRASPWIYQDTWSLPWGPPANTFPAHLIVDTANRGIAMGLPVNMIFAMGSPCIQGPCHESLSIHYHRYGVTRQTWASPCGFPAVNNIVMVWCLSAH